MVNNFPRGYGTEEFTLRMITDKDHATGALKDFLGRAIGVVNHVHQDLSVSDLNKVLMELTNEYEDSKP